MLRTAFQGVGRWIGRTLSWHLLLVALVFGGIVHIVSTLAIPMVGRTAGLVRQEATVAFNTMVVLPPARPGREPLAFSDPADRVAVCHLDLRAGPVGVTVRMPSRGWVLGIYSREGDNIYSLSSTTLRDPAVALTIEPPRERLFGIFALPQPTSVDPSRVVSTVHDPVVIIRAPSRGEAFAAGITKALEQATCAALERRG